MSNSGQTDGQFDLTAIGIRSPTQAYQFVERHGDRIPNRLRESLLATFPQDEQLSQLLKRPDGKRPS
jgi:hypothetical protein